LFSGHYHTEIVNILPRGVGFAVQSPRLQRREGGRPTKLQQAAGPRNTSISGISKYSMPNARFRGNCGKFAANLQKRVRSSCGTIRKNQRNMAEIKLNFFVVLCFQSIFPAL
jgi:hypothetical protein